MRVRFVLICLLYASACQNNTSSVKSIEEDNQTSVDVVLNEIESMENNKGNSDLIDLGIPAHVEQTKGKIFPVDEGLLSDDLHRFRSDLLYAIQRRDTAFIMGLIDVNSKISFGGEGGKTGFRIMWGLGAEYLKSQLWDVLEVILMMGGQFQDDERQFFVTPYAYSAWPDAYDAFSYAVITGSNVRVRADAGIKSQVLTALSYDIVGYNGVRSTESDTIGNAVFPWYQITLNDGRIGWVYGQYFRSPIDFRAGFERAEDGWRIVFLVAGD